jgi:hypothetical protein
MRYLKWKWGNETCYREDNRGCAPSHPAPGELSIHFFKQILKPSMKIPSMLRIGGQNTGSDDKKRRREKLNST